MRVLKAHRWGVSPKLAATAWESGSSLLSAMPGQDAFGVATSVARLFALVLPVLGVTLIVLPDALSGQYSTPSAEERNAM